MRKDTLKKIVVRVLTPQIVSSLYYFVKYRAYISLRAEVDLSRNFTIGENCIVGAFTKIKVHGGWMKVGDRVGIATGCFIAALQKGIQIGDNFICGPNVNIIGGNYDISQKDVHLDDVGITSRGVSIGRNVWIGAGSTILDGSQLGDNTIVVANSLINRRYPPNVILQGSPAKIIMRR